jgi:processive 1,2-diacylglycerol beta-glucosyltransferase
MKRVLFLPLLQMPSGHHQVADALIRSLEKRVEGISCRKVDFLSYVNKRLEKIVTGTYMKWIYYAPQMYEWTYRHCACSATHAKNYQLKWYERLFQEKMEQLLREEKPDLIVCTHAFPSFLISRLKEQGRTAVPTINVYTDFFINEIWGRRGIDYHFVPTASLKNELMREYNIQKERIYVTGIPVDEYFHHTDKKFSASPPYKVLISGGSNGLGGILPLLQKLKTATGFQYFILCGNNERLFHEIASWKLEHVRPLDFISSRKQMNDWYEQADAIVTKPGGVTISEALWKKTPVFVHTALPGQEEVNLRYLESQKLVYRLCSNLPCEIQIRNVLDSEEERNHWLTHIEDYHRDRETIAWEKIHELIE